jgi:very-short-patch-repair endonuclease
MSPKASPFTARARQLRRNQSDAENRLWFQLRSRQLGVKFRRQEPIGPFIVDFCAVDPKLIVEVDGGQHAAQEARDADRTACLERSGYRVLRFWNTEVLGNAEGVVERIAQELEMLRGTRERRKDAR